MCNEAARRTALGLMRDDFRQVRIELSFPEGLPNLSDAPSIRITDTSVIVCECAAGAEMVQRRWSWVGASNAPGRAGKPVYNYRSEGRVSGNSATGGRCLIPLDGFYEFTDAAATPKRKDKWLFTLAETEPERAAPGMFCVAGLWRAGVESGSRSGGPATGEAWTMLTCAPGPDIAPYHDRQIVVLPRASWADWPGGVVPAAELIAPSPAGTFAVAPAR